VVLFRFVPAVALRWFNADTVIGPVLLLDVLEFNGSVRAFAWGGLSTLFPDIAGFYAFRLFTSDSIVALQGIIVLTFAGFVSLPVLLHRLSGCRSTRTFAALVLVVFVAVAGDVGLWRDLQLSIVLAPGCHGGGALMTLACLVLLVHVLDTGAWRWPAWLMGAICFATAASDYLFLVTFTVPACLTLCASMTIVRRGPSFARPLVAATATVAASSVFGALAAPWLFPASLATSSYTVFRPAAAFATFGTIAALCRQPQGRAFAVLLTLDVAFVAFAVARLFKERAAGRAGRRPDRAITPVVFVAALVASSWGAVIAIGVFTGVASLRYVTLALLGPLLMTLAWLHQRVTWTGPWERGACVAAALAVGSTAVCLAPALAPYLVQGRQVGEFLGGVQRTEHIEAGLAEYWWANPVTLLTRGAVRLRPVDQDGSVRRWISSSAWYEPGPATSAPRFRMILMRGLDEARIRGKFGEPSRVLSAPGGVRDVWLYSEEHAITFDPVFGLCNDRSCPAPGRYHAAAASLPSRVGEKQRGSVVASAPRDPVGHLTFGPYLPLPPGRYRVTVAYAYGEPPPPGQTVRYDVVRWSSPAGVTLDGGEIPFISTSPATFVRDITIPGGKAVPVEVRTWFPGSGRVRIDWLEIAYVGR